MQPLINEMVAQRCRLDNIIAELQRVVDAIKLNAGGGGNSHPPIDIVIRQVNVNPGSTAATVAGPNSNRFSITIQNVGPDACWVGVVQAMGTDEAMLLENGADITLEMFRGSVYALTEGSNDKAHLHIMEAVIL
jgi:hypothetical protein